jgi:hypothetical protein
MKNSPAEKQIQKDAGKDPKREGRSPGNGTEKDRARSVVKNARNGCERHENGLNGVFFWWICALSSFCTKVA